ncbi:MAG: hypothetical protein J7507_08140 [Pseudoxanthomonas sp.]|nr:hypothetical protein [Pseudoxanthomonas sp.]
MSVPTPFAPGRYAGGQPTADQLAAFAREGVRTVINLRGPAEAVDYDEAVEAARLGLHYVAVPVTGAADLDRERVRVFGRALDQARGDGAVLVHCASSNRAGAMVALDHLFNRGGSLAGALELGRAAGLKDLDQAVVALAGREGVG